MGEPAPRPLPTRICKKCGRELPETAEYFAPTTGWSPGTLRRSCRRCRNSRDNELKVEATAIKHAVQAAGGGGKWTPKVMGESGPEGGFTEHPHDGYRFVALPDSHGCLIDWPAAQAACAFIRYYRPVRVFLLGDHVDFAAFSRFDKPPTDAARIREDIEDARKFLTMVRESAPEARISYRKGNHEARLERHLWKNEALAKMMEADGMDLPHTLHLDKLNIEWIPSGTEVVNDRLIIKHGHMVRMRAGYTATGELERNGVSGISGHTHRLGQIYKRSRLGVSTWVESGCLCQYDPDYMEGQVSDWQHGLSFGSISLRGHGFTVHTAPIIKGKVMALEKAIGE